MNKLHLSDLIRNIGLVYILPNQKESLGNVDKKTVFAINNFRIAKTVYLFKELV